MHTWAYLETETMYLVTDESLDKSLKSYFKSLSLRPLGASREWAGYLVLTNASKYLW